MSDPPSFSHAGLRRGDVSNITGMFQPSRIRHRRTWRADGGLRSTCWMRLIVIVPSDGELDRSPLRKRARQRLCASVLGRSPVGGGLDPMRRSDARRRFASRGVQSERGHVLAGGTPKVC